MAEAAVVGRVEAAQPASRVYLSALRLTLAALTLFALALRLYALDHESLWLDEGYTLFFSGMPLPRLFLVGGAHEHPPLYYLVVHLTLGVWPSYLVPRVLSAIAGALSVPLLYLLGRRLLCPPAGLIAAVLLAISPFHLWYSQNGRAYELAGLLVLLSYLALLSAADSGRRIDWALYVAATALALFTEYTTVLVLIPQALLLRRVPRALLLSWVAVLIAYLPWLGVLARDTVSVAGDYWIPVPTLDGVANTVLEFFGLVTPCPSPPCTGHAIPLVAGHEVLLAGIAVLALIVAAAWALRRHSFPVSLLLAWLTVPFAVVLPLAAVRSLYLDRIFLDATFPLYLLIGLAVAASARNVIRGAAYAGLSILIVASGIAMSYVYADSSNPDWRSLARDLAAAYRPGQAVMFNPGVLRTLIDSYLPAGWHATRERSLWSRAYLDVPGWQRYYPDAAKTDYADRMRVEAELRDRQLANVAKGGREVWLVTYDYPGLNDSRRWFADHGFQSLVSQIYAGDTRLELWSRTDPSTAGHAVSPSGTAGWRTHGSVQWRKTMATEKGTAAMERSFAVQAGQAYTVHAEYRALPPAGPDISVQVYDRTGRLLATFPRTQWYDLPVTGVWLHQPFGFVAPPGSARAVLRAGNHWGQTRWQNLAVYRVDR